jgi:hypothetical protein
MNIHWDTVSKICFDYYVTTPDDADIAYSTIDVGALLTETCVLLLRRSLRNGGRYTSYN